MEKSVSKEKLAEINEANYSDLQSWLIATLAAGGEVSHFGNKFTAILGRNKSATFDIKKGKGSISESFKDLREKSVSQAQQKMMGMALAYKRGDMDDVSPEVKKMADSMSMKDLEDFAKTKHKGLPVKKESSEHPIDEARKDSAADLYFDTYSAAVQAAKAQAEKKGFEVVEDDWFQQVTTGKGKPGRGKTTRHNLDLTKDGKPVKKRLAIQVYNRDTNRNTYELNMYIESTNFFGLRGEK